MTSVMHKIARQKNMVFEQQDFKFSLLVFHWFLGPSLLKSFAFNISE